MLLATKLAEVCCDRLTFRSFRKLFVTYMVVSHKIFYGEAVLRPVACAPGGKCPLRVCRPPPSYAIVVTYLAGCDAVPQTAAAAAAAADRLVSAILKKRAEKFDSASLN